MPQISIKQTTAFEGRRSSFPVLRSAGGPLKSVSVASASFAVDPNAAAAVRAAADTFPSASIVWSAMQAAGQVGLGGIVSCEVSPADPTAFEVHFWCSPFTIVDIEVDAVLA